MEAGSINTATSISPLGQSQWGFIRVSWTLIMLMWHHINEERDYKSFMRVESFMGMKLFCIVFQNLDVPETVT
jgi:hypothetical protein